MAQLFPRWTNKAPLYVLIAVTCLVFLTIFIIWYYGSPKYTDAGYQPQQPIPYSHKLHVGDLGMDCRYCHSQIEFTAMANIPSTQTCMNCHSIILKDSDKLMPLKESRLTNKPIQWIKIHKLPDYAYFDHSAHLSAGIGCSSCHGQIDKMEVVHQVQPLSMSWCLECHRNPENHIRPVSEITNMNWKPLENQKEFALGVIDEKKLNPPVECSGCHR